MDALADHAVPLDGTTLRRDRADLAPVDDRRVRWVGSVYDPADPGRHVRATDLPGSFDGLFVLGKSTPTRPLDPA